MQTQPSDDSAWRERLSIVIPAHEEATTIVRTLNGLREVLSDCEIIVVDDGSLDETAQVAGEVPDVRVVRHPINRGYGASLKTGMSLAEGDYIAWFDADGEHRPTDLVALVQHLHEERLMAVIGHRTNPGRSAFRSLGKFGIRMLARALGVNTGSDLNCGLRVFRREAILPNCPLLPDGFSASMTSTMVMLARSYPIAFQPVTVNSDASASSVTVRDGFATLMLVVRMVTLFAPLRIFLRLGALFLGVGAIYGLTMALVLGLGLPVAALLLMNAGMLLCMLGLIADQISQIRLAQLERVEQGGPPPHAPPADEARRD